MDSACVQHMCNNLNLLTNIRHLTTPVNILLLQGTNLSPDISWAQLS